MNQMGAFEYIGRVKITWVKNGNIHTVKKHEQLDYEELCFENTEPERFVTTDSVAARDCFYRWVTEFVK